MIPYFEIPRISLGLKKKQNELMAGLRRTASLRMKKSPVVIQMVEQQLEPDMDFPKENWSPRRYEVRPETLTGLKHRLQNPAETLTGLKVSDYRQKSDYLSRLNKGGVFLENPDESISKGLLGRRGKKRFITVPDETYFGWAEGDHLHFPKNRRYSDFDPTRYAFLVDEKTYQNGVAVPINNWTEFLIIRHIKSQEGS